MRYNYEMQRICQLLYKDPATWAFRPGVITAHL